MVFYQLYVRMWDHNECCKSDIGNYVSRFTGGACGAGEINLVHQVIVFYNFEWRKRVWYKVNVSLTSLLLHTFNCFSKVSVSVICMIFFLFVAPKFCAHWKVMLAFSKHIFNLLHTRAPSTFWNRASEIFFSSDILWCAKWNYDERYSTA